MENLSVPDINYGAILPMLILFGAACVGVLLEAFLPRRVRHPVQLTLALVSLVAALVAVILTRSTRTVTAGGAIAVDGPTLFLQGSILLLGVVSLLLIGTFTVNKTVAVIATLGIILAAAYVLWMVQRTTQGTLNPVMAEVDGMKRDISLREKFVVGPLILLLLLLGFYPKPVTDVINPAVQATLQQDVGVQDPRPTEVTEAAR